MNYREIPEGSVEVQTGLWLYTYTKTIGSNTYTFGEVYASEGYCFYNLTVGENFDEEGNLVPAEDRVYAVYSTAGLNATADSVNAIFVSVPYQEGYEVVNVPTNPPVTA